MNKIQKQNLAAMIAGSIVVAGCTAIQYMSSKRDTKRQIQNDLSRKIAFAHMTESIEAINEDLDRRIAIAKKALLDDEFYEITRNY